MRRRRNSEQVNFALEKNRVLLTHPSDHARLHASDPHRSAIRPQFLARDHSRLPPRTRLQSLSAAQRFPPLRPSQRFSASLSGSLLFIPPLHPCSQRFSAFLSVSQRFPPLHPCSAFLSVSSASLSGSLLFIPAQRFSAFLSGSLLPSLSASLSVSQRLSAVPSSSSLSLSASLSVSQRFPPLHPCSAFLSVSQRFPPLHPCSAFLSVSQRFPPLHPCSAFLSVSQRLSAVPSSSSLLSVSQRLSAVPSPSSLLSVSQRLSAVPSSSSLLSVLSASLSGSLLLRPCSAFLSVSQRFPPLRPCSASLSGYSSASSDALSNS